MCGIPCRMGIGEVNEMKINEFQHVEIGGSRRRGIGEGILTMLRYNEFSNDYLY